VRSRGGEQGNQRGADTAGGPDDKDSFTWPNLRGGRDRAGGQADGGRRRRLVG
jgi:hypothetical protein